MARVMLVAGAISAAAGLAPVHAQENRDRSIAEAPPNSAEGIVRPRRGMTMDAVRSQFGQPSDIKPAVGEPPITRWIYDRFTVFFEHEYVLHSVVHTQERK